MQTLCCRWMFDIDDGAVIKPPQQITQGNFFSVDTGLADSLQDVLPMGLLAQSLAGLQEIAHGLTAETRCLQQGAIRTDALPAIRELVADAVMADGFFDEGIAQLLVALQRDGGVKYLAFLWKADSTIAASVANHAFGQHGFKFLALQRYVRRAAVGVALQEVLAAAELTGSYQGDKRKEFAEMGSNGGRCQEQEIFALQGVDKVPGGIGFARFLIEAVGFVDDNEIEGFANKLISALGLAGGIHTDDDALRWTPLAPGIVDGEMLVDLFLHFFLPLVGRAWPDKNEDAAHQASHQ